MTAPPCPPPKSLLGRHRLLAPSASVYVSPICLGGMNFGEAWKDRLGSCSKETTFEILDYFYEQGGNFIDTANQYQDEESEQWIGEWLESRGVRDEIVLATKYSSGYKVNSARGKIQSNFGGNGSKSLHVSVEDSLRKLRTGYVDVLYVHYWDLATTAEELMQSLNALVQARKVLYLGVSDAPAWWVVKCNSYARQHGMRPFSVYQGRWSAAARDLEREVLGMCEDQGMGIAPWGCLGGGYFKPKADGNAAAAEGRKMDVKTGREAGVADVLGQVAARVGAPMTSVAMAYVLHKAPYVFPIVGGRKVEHLRGNIEALGLGLSQEDIEEIETGYDFDVGFPYDFLGGGKVPRGPADVVFTQRFGNFDYLPPVGGMKPHKGPLSTHDPKWV
ncbi:norsolorinic acid reductase [Colletotrichum plurivorum]|uniref:Norsolorinic acid reductase n=1 Tax=Colletotrichum plurivorum TaxID=2175906 RepID=A0A8H6KXM4_9PEZI|nr:norsolorinic acid reductase [Colletotrichum plurivorum]